MSCPSSRTWILFFNFLIFFVRILSLFLSQSICKFWPQKIVNSFGHRFYCLCVFSTRMMAFLSVFSHVTLWPQKQQASGSHQQIQAVCQLHFLHAFTSICCRSAARPRTVCFIHLLSEFIISKSINFTVRPHDWPTEASWSRYMKRGVSHLFRTLI